MSIKRGDLKSAHRGYLFQDIATAYLLVCSLTDGFDSVVVDRKIVDGDNLDDCEVNQPGKRVRRQFKSSSDPNRSLSENDFLTGSLRIDRLLLTHVRLGDSAADEYRLCATWSPPLADDALQNKIESVLATPTLQGTDVAFYRLLPNAIWPEDGTPGWAPLLSGVGDDSDYSRANFIEFCRRFIIELRLPNTSQNLAEPGPLENALIDKLIDRVGIGKYPNRGRRAADVASHAVNLATIARTKAETLTPNKVAWLLNVRTDFGRIAQAFALDESVYRDRPTFRAGISAGALRGKHQIVTGPPGSGKSWELTRLVEDLRASENTTVACHYCYLEPGDERLEERVTTDALFANLTAELVEEDPLLKKDVRLSVGSDELERLLLKAVRNGRRVILIIDGLDHITRVRDGSNRLSDTETDIIERLATLDLPEGVTVVIGSQPGEHLRALRERWGDEADERPVPRWEAADVEALAEAYGVMSVFERLGMDAVETASAIEVFAATSDGNPLYARYLCRALTAGILRGEITSVSDWFASAPQIEGDIALYYRKLYQSAARETQAVADIFGVIDFGVSETDLDELIPKPFNQFTKKALADLAPILTEVAGQGGFRIFHESFRRFIRDELARSNRSVSAALDPVISWLRRAGFFESAKSYRFLLPSLRRSGCVDELFALVDKTFVAQSLSYAHPMEAVLKNLALATDAAARAQNWPILVRCAELHRATICAFSESQNSWTEYWRAYLELFGPKQLATRLLYDGKPTLNITEGLFACLLVDDAGVVAPWTEYLAEAHKLPEPNHYRNDSVVLSDYDTIQVAELAATLYRGNVREAFRRVVGYLQEVRDNFRIALIRAVAARFTRQTRPSLVEAYVKRGLRSDSITRNAACVIRLGIADELMRSNEVAQAGAVVNAALHDDLIPELAVECMTLGADVVRCASLAVNPAKLPIAVGPDTFVHEAVPFRRWFASVRLFASDAASGTAIVAHERARISGQGWYRCWLTYAIEIAKAEARARRGEGANVLSAFQELTRDTRPFVGDPRSCDLYAIRGLIRETLALGLSLLASADEWRTALSYVVGASHSLATGIDREDGGPIPTKTVLELLLENVTKTTARDEIIAVLEAEFSYRDENPTYYPTHAAFAISLARGRHAAGDSVGALEAWRHAGIFAASYGWRKDTTIYELMGSAPTLARVSSDLFVSAMKRLQLLADTVTLHTDGRSTRKAPNAWFRVLSGVKPHAAAALLAKTNVAEEGTGGWQVADAIKVICERLSDADGSLRDALLRTVDFTIDADNVGRSAMLERLEPLRSLATTDPQLSLELLRNVLADIEGDNTQKYRDAAVAASDFAADNGLEIPILHNEPEERADVEQHASPQTSSGAKNSVPSFPDDGSFVDILRVLKTSGRNGQFERGANWDITLEPLSLRIDALLSQNRVADVERLLVYFAREVKTDFFLERHPLSRLGHFLEQAGHLSAAALSYALGFSAARGGWGEILGSKHREPIERAMALDRDITLRAVANELSYTFAGDAFMHGHTENVISLLEEWYGPELAAAAWNEAYDVIAYRLPLKMRRNWFSNLSDGDIGNSSNESIVALLLARLSDPRISRKLDALRGIALAIARAPEAASRPLQWWFGSNEYASSSLAVLGLLLLLDKNGHRITADIQSSLSALAASERWGESFLARLLLKRANLRCNATATIDPEPLKHEINLSLMRQRLEHSPMARSVEQLSAYLPGLEEDVLHCASAALAIEGSHGRISSRFQLSYGSHNDVRPPADVLHWGTEVFVDSINRTLSRHVGDETSHPIHFMAAIGSCLVPDIPTHTALTFNRTVRPRWSLPSQTGRFVSPVLAVGDEDPTYAGWRRLGLVERECVYDHAGYNRRPIAITESYCGVMAAEDLDMMPSNATPFAKVPSTLWFDPTERAPDYFDPTIIGLATVDDWLGVARLLVPPPIWAHEFGLDGPVVPGPLVWHDANGPAIVLRTWRVRNDHAFSEDSYYLRGCDLIARPGMLPRIEALHGTQLWNVSVARQVGLER